VNGLAVSAAKPVEDGFPRARARAFPLHAPRRLCLRIPTLARALFPEKPGSLLGTREKFKFRQFPTRRGDGKLSFAPPCIGFITSAGWRERESSFAFEDNRVGFFRGSSEPVRPAKRESARSLNSRSPRAHLLARRHPALQR